MGTRLATYLMYDNQNHYYYKIIGVMIAAERGSGVRRGLFGLS